MIQIEDKTKCCGCEACIQICPQQCITAVSDSEGFLYPKADPSRCVRCRLCLAVCPMQHLEEPKKPLAAFAAKNPDPNVRESSSSGGLFTQLAEETLRRGGTVFGAVFDENFEVQHRGTAEHAELAAFRGSKYVQSRIGDAFRETDRLLREGRTVLFSGTPCQIAGLRGFIRRKDDNLHLAAVVCHGVPSPGVWRDYLRSLSLKSGSPIAEVRFRDKETGWKKYSLTVRTADGQVPASDPFYRNPYMKGFIANYSLRPSCYACPFKAGRCGSDLMLADFWGADRIMPDYDDDRGISLVTVYSDKGREMLHRSSADIRPANYAQALEFNSNLESSVDCPPQRSRFFALCETRSVPEALDRITRRPLHRRVLSLAVRLLRRFNPTK